MTVIESREINPYEDAEFLVAALRCRRANTMDRQMEDDLGRFLFAIVDMAVAILSKEKVDLDKWVPDARSIAILQVTKAIDRLEIRDAQAAVNYLVKVAQNSVRHEWQRDAKRAAKIEFASLEEQLAKGDITPTDENVFQMMKVFNTKPETENGKKVIRGTGGGARCRGTQPEHPAG